MTLTIRIPQLVPPTPNKTRREHPMVGARRVKRERAQVALILNAKTRPALPVNVTVVRCAPGKMDGHDNLPFAMKAVVDEVAKWLGVDDRDDRVRWFYEQKATTELRKGTVLRFEAVESVERVASADGREHKRLLLIMPKLPGDYDPWGKTERWKDPKKAYPDCSSGCRFARWLEGDLGADWCVCTNPKSHRVGLLTFEHQGCQAFVLEKESRP